MTELFPRLEASNTAVGGRPGLGGWRVRRCSFVSSLSIADRASRPRIGNLNGHRMGRMPQLGCRRLREPTVHVYMSRQGRTCIRQLGRGNQGRGGRYGAARRTAEGPQSPTPRQRGRDHPPRAVLGRHERTARARHAPGCGPALTANCSGAEVGPKSPKIPGDSQRDTEITLIGSPELRSQSLSHWWYRRWPISWNR
jgi:hypothetical protein